MLYLINKFLAVQHQKLFEFPEAFQNRQGQILCSYWNIDFLGLHQQLLKTSKGAISPV